MGALLHHETGIGSYDTLGWTGWKPLGTRRSTAPG